MEDGIVWIIGVFLSEHVIDGDGLLLLPEFLVEARVIGEMVDGVSEHILVIEAKKGQNELSDFVFVVEDDHDLILFMRVSSFDDVVLVKDIFLVFDGLSDGVAIAVDHAGVAAILSASASFKDGCADIGEAGDAVIDLGCV